MTEAEPTKALPCGCDSAEPELVPVDFAWFKTAPLPDALVLLAGWLPIRCNVCKARCGAAKIPGAVLGEGER